MLPKKAVRWCLSVIVIGIFLCALFAFVGMPIYAAIAEISYEQGWTNLIEAIRAAINK